MNEPYAVAAPPRSSAVGKQHGYGWLLDGSTLLMALVALLVQWLPSVRGYVAIGNLTINVLLIVPICALALLYRLGIHRIQRTGVPPLAWRQWSFQAGVVFLLLVLGSTLDYLGHELLTAHMLQYMLLVFIAAPLLVLGRPGSVCARALPLPIQQIGSEWYRRSAALRQLVALQQHPTIVWALNLVTLWLWHWVPLYELAIRDQRFSALKHAIFVLGAIQFWRVVLLPLLEQQRAAYGWAIGLSFATMLQSSALGALLTMLRQPLYPFYEELARLCFLTFCTFDDGARRPFGLSLMQDQELAGLLMWIPGGMLYVVLIVALLIAWLQTEERRRRAAFASAAGEPSRW
jgi:putative membrane protein